MQCNAGPGCLVPQICASARLALVIKNYVLFMIPKRVSDRLSITMQFTNTSWQTWLQPHQLAVVELQPKESKLKLSLETRNRGDVMIVHCQGRIVYRDEAAALSQVVGELLRSGGKVVLDLSGVISIDSAGIGELISLYTRAQSQNSDLKVANPAPIVRELLDLTNVDSVLEIHSNLNEALAAFQLTEACADC
ncbi:MAG: anti-sigma-factor antagonist [Candidatus Sulfotelmatobacter sp.]|nr:anti-sigma-factor antagonist [Candidatus Sulfotelmatobacter sp.]